MDSESLSYSVKGAVHAVKDPTTYSWITYAWVFILAIWGGTIRYLNSIKDQEVPIRQVAKELLVGGMTSGFVGLVTFFLCESAGFDPLWTAVCVAVTGHMGAESMVILRKVVCQRIGK